MSRATLRAFYMLLGSAAAGELPPVHDCPPYTRQPNTAVDINLDQVYVALPSDAVDINICEEIQ